MGNSQQHSHNTNSYQFLSFWKTVKTVHANPTYMYVTDKITGIIGEVTQLQLQRQGQQIQLYRERQSSMCGYLVKIMAVYPFNHSDSHNHRYFPAPKNGYQVSPFSTLYKNRTNKMYVVTEYVPYRLSNIGRILTQDQATYMIACVLEGLYEILTNINNQYCHLNGGKKIKGFYIDQNMIGITQKGIMKVWCNQNYAVNEFVQQKYDSCGLQRNGVIQLGQGRMIDRVVQLVDKHMSVGQYINAQLGRQLNNLWRRDLLNKKQIAARYYLKLSIKDIRNGLASKLYSLYGDPAVTHHEEQSTQENMFNKSRYEQIGKQENGYSSRSTVRNGVNLGNNIKIRASSVYGRRQGNSGLYRSTVLIGQSDRDRSMVRSVNMSKYATDMHRSTNDQTIHTSNRTISVTNIPNYVTNIPNYVTNIPNSVTDIPNSVISIPNYPNYPTYNSNYSKNIHNYSTNNYQTNTNMFNHISNTNTPNYAANRTYITNFNKPTPTNTANIYQNSLYMSYQFPTNQLYQSQISNSLTSSHIFTSRINENNGLNMCRKTTTQISYQNNNNSPKYNNNSPSYNNNSPSYPILKGIKLVQQKTVNPFQSPMQNKSSMQNKSPMQDKYKSDIILSSAYQRPRTVTSTQRNRNIPSFRPIRIQLTNSNTFIHQKNPTKISPHREPYLSMDQQ